MNLFKEKTRILGLIFLTAFCGASVAVVIKIATNSLPLLVIIFYRFLFASIFIVPYLIKVLLKRKLPYIKISLMTLPAILNVGLFTYGIRFTTPSYGALIYSLTPAIILIFSFIFIKEKISGYKITGLLVGFIGVFLVIFEPLWQNGSVLFVYGNIIILGASFCYAIFSLFSKSLQKEIKPEIITSIFLLNTFLLSLPLIIFFYPLKSLINLDFSQLMLLLYAGVIGSVLFYFFHQYLIKISTPVISSTVLYIQPLIVILISSFLFKENLSGIFILGSICALFGTYLITKS